MTKKSCAVEMRNAILRNYLNSQISLLFRSRDIPALRTFARKFSNIDFFMKILSLKDDELVMSEM